MKKAKDITSNPQTIKMERRYGDHYSYFTDVNGILKGEWGDYEKLSEKGPDGEAMFVIFSNRFMQRIIINEYGFFFNVFSCKKYDIVIKLSEELYLCEKNERFGLLDNNENSILHTCYNSINCCDRKIGLFIVTTEIGKFLFNYQIGKTSEVYEDIHYSDHDYFVYKESDMYGLMNGECEVLLNPQPEYEYKPNCNLETRNLLYINFENTLFGITVKDEKLYGKIPLNKYDICFKVGHNDAFKYFYVTKKNTKYGLLNWKCECVTEPKYDELILFKGKYNIEVHRTSYTIEKDIFKDYIFVICKERNKYSLYNVQQCECIVSGCDQMDYIIHWDNSEFTREKTISISYVKDGKQGYVTYYGVNIFSNEYNSIEVLRYYFVVSKDNRYGALNAFGAIIAPCIYDRIKCNRRGELIGIIDGEETILNPIPKDYIDDDSDYEYERPSYGRYAGTYAQDEAGYSDDDIDTIFDGDPDAYWNID